MHFCDDRHLRQQQQEQQKSFVIHYTLASVHKFGQSIYKTIQETHFHVDTNTATHRPSVYQSVHPSVRPLYVARTMNRLRLSLGICLGC